MYASNEHEFQREHDEWVVLRESPPTTNILSNAISLLDYESSSDSSSSIDDSSSKSDRSDSLSSFASHEHENLPNNEDSLLTSQEIDNNNDLLSIGEIKDEVLPSELVIKQTNESETTPVINEYDLYNNGQEISNESIQPQTHLRRRTGANIQQTTEERSVSTEHEYSSSIKLNHSKPKAHLRTKIVIILFLSLLLTLCCIIMSQKSMIEQLTHQLETTNEQINYIKMFSIGNLEQKLSQQLEEHFQNLNKQFAIKLEQEKSSFILQINELNQNLTNETHHLTNDNHQLKERIIALEQQLNEKDKKNLKANQSSSRENHDQRSPLPSMNVLLSHLIKQTSSITENTPINLTGLFEQLSTSVSDLIDHGQEYVEESKRKLTDFAASTTAKQVQQTIRRGMENLSSSIRQAQSTYVEWLRTRAERREQARKDTSNKYVKTDRRPWRWTFQRGQDREQMRTQKPITKKT